MLKPHYHHYDDRTWAPKHFDIVAALSKLRHWALNRRNFAAKIVDTAISQMAIVEELSNAAVDKLPVIVNGLVVALLVAAGSRGLGAVKAGELGKETLESNAEVIVRVRFSDLLY